MGTVSRIFIMIIMAVMTACPAMGAGLGSLAPPTPRSSDALPPQDPNADVKFFLAPGKRSSIEGLSWRFLGPRLVERTDARGNVGLYAEARGVLLGENQALLIGASRVRLSSSGAFAAVFPVNAHEQAFRLTMVDRRGNVEEDVLVIKVNNLEQIRKAQNKNKRFWSVSPYYFQSEISSQDPVTGGVSSLSSSLDAGVRVSYVRRWTESFDSYLKLQAGVVGFEPVTGGRNLQSSSVLVAGGGLGVDLGNLDLSRWQVQLELGYMEELFERAASASTLAVDSLWTPEFKVIPKLKVYSDGPLNIGLDISGGVELPASGPTYSTQLGISYGAGVFFVYGSGDKLRISGDLGLLVRSQDTSITDQSETDIGLSVTVAFPTGFGP